MQPTQTEVAIFKTLVYGDIFDYPLTVKEIHHFLIEDSASLEQVQSTLDESEWLRQRVTQVNCYYATRPETADIRDCRQKSSEKLWGTAVRYGIWMAYLPFVRMVALTGALAMHNASDDDDDLDYLVVTARGRVWLARLLVVVMVRVARLWGVRICPNYVVSETRLTQQRQDLYIAHELVQMVPVSGAATYQQMRAANDWLTPLMPNANGNPRALPPHEPRGLPGLVQISLEWLLRGRLGDWLEEWERKRKTAKFIAEEAQSDHSAAIIDQEQVKGHFQDDGHPVLNRFYERLQEHGID
jgi:hypothetical protein